CVRDEGGNYFDYW
nr:immunoglobulin heavy chain junction region [Mus musculus]